MNIYSISSALVNVDNMPPDVVTRTVSYSVFTDGAISHWAKGELFELGKDVTKAFKYSVGVHSYIVSRRISTSQRKHTWNLIVLRGGGVNSPEPITAEHLQAVDPYTAIENRDLNEFVQPIIANDLQLFEAAEHVQQAENLGVPTAIVTSPLHEYRIYRIIDSTGSRYFVTRMALAKTDNSLMMVLIEALEDDNLNTALSRYFYMEPERINLVITPTFKPYEIHVE